MKHRISAAAGVNVGKRRENNEDNLYFNGVYMTEQTREHSASLRLECSDARQLYAVCDGMGGEQHGELASLLAIEMIHRYARSIKNDTKTNIDEQIKSCIFEANYSICQAQIKHGMKRIGTTLALLAVNGKTVNTYNVGDSRVYLLREGKLTQLSEDHTYVEGIVKLGGLTPEQAKTHPQRNLLTQFLGINPAEMIIDAHRNTLKMKPKDIFLLCSDGLSDAVDEGEMCRILTESGNSAEAVTKLVDEALRIDGRDNITVIVAAFNRD